MTVKVTILGAGATGLMIACRLPRHYDITVVGDKLPGDPPDRRGSCASAASASLWLGEDTPSSNGPGPQAPDKPFLLDYLSSRLVGGKMVNVRVFADYGSPKDIWYDKHVSDLRALSEDQLREGAKYGVEFRIGVVSPLVYLAHLRRELERVGIKFKRARVKRLSDLRCAGHNFLVNATGIGAADLEDVRDPAIVPIREQAVLIQNHFPVHTHALVHLREDYKYVALPREDSLGGVYLGGIIECNSMDERPDPEQRELACQLFQHAQREEPEFFASPYPEDYDYTDLVGIYPSRDGGPRLEREEIGGQIVFHAYGHDAGYTCCLDVAGEVARLISLEMGQDKSLPYDNSLHKHNSLEVDYSLCGSDLRTECLTRPARKTIWHRLQRLMEKLGGKFS